ncbi:MAG: hypothetical protein MHPSP_001812, partial [Paramarteilia canceri]
GKTNCSNGELVSRKGCVCDGTPIETTDGELCYYKDSCYDIDELVCDSNMVLSHDIFSGCPKCVKPKCKNGNMTDICECKGITKDVADGKRCYYKESCNNIAEIVCKDSETLVPSSNNPCPECTDTNCTSGTKVLDCRCKDKLKLVQDGSRCYSNSKCPGVDRLTCENYEILSHNDDTGCPDCVSIHCNNKELVEKCYCDEEYKVQLADSLFYCNKGASECTSSISFGNCPENKFIDYKVNISNNELEGCPVCELRECEELETFEEENDCHCEGGNTLKLNEGLNYCNKGAKKCDVNVNFDNCKNPNQVLNYALSNGRKSLNGCPTCDLRICENLHEVQDCKCDNKTVYNTVNGKTYCIDHNECNDLELNGDGKCTNGSYPIFSIEQNLLAKCPECPDEPGVKGVSAKIIAVSITVPLAGIIFIIIVAVIIVKKRNKDSVQFQMHQQIENVPQNYAESNSVRNNNDDGDYKSQNEGYYMYSESRDR